MSKKKHKKKPPQATGGFKHFTRELYQVLQIAKFDNKVLNLSHAHKRMMYNHSIRICNPKAANEYISSREVKLITQKMKAYYRVFSYGKDGIILSGYQFQLLFCFTAIMKKVIEKEYGEKDHPDALAYEEGSKDFLRAFNIQFALNYFKVVTQLSSPEHKYYGIQFRIAKPLKWDPKLEMVSEIYGVPPRKCILKVNGNNRPAYQLGKALATEPVAWISAETALLGDFYKGGRKELDVYIQAHALRRLRERLDILDNEAVNYALWENTSTMKPFMNYRGYLLYPFQVHAINIGYLVANVVDDKLLFRTFLFITHSCTPEGDRLKKLSGLGKQDISYWHIDRLSTFLDVNEDKHPGLARLFDEAGLGELQQLHGKDYTIETLQSANLEALEEYISKGSQIKNVQAAELELEAQ